MSEEVIERGTLSYIGELTKDNVIEAFRRSDLEFTEELHSKWEEFENEDEWGWEDIKEHFYDKLNPLSLRRKGYTTTLFVHDNKLFVMKYKKIDDVSEIEYDNDGTFLFDAHYYNGGSHIDEVVDSLLTNHGTGDLVSFDKRKRLTK